MAASAAAPAATPAGDHGLLSKRTTTTTTTTRSAPSDDLAGLLEAFEEATQATRAYSSNSKYFNHDVNSVNICL